MNHDSSRACSNCDGSMVITKVTKRTRRAGFCGVRTTYGAAWRCEQCGCECWTPITKREANQYNAERRGGEGDK